MNTLATVILIIAVIFLAGACVMALWVLYEEVVEMSEEEEGVDEMDDDNDDNK